MFEKYSAKKQIEKRISSFDYAKKCDYVRGILKKGKLLEDPTKKAAYSVLGDLNLGIGLAEEAVIDYIRAGEFKKAEKITSRFNKFYPNPAEKLQGLRKNMNRKLVEEVGWEKRRGLEKSVGVTGAILGFGGAILSLSLNVTGNAIGNIPTNSFNFIGFVFLGMGIASAALLMMRD